MYVSRCGPSLFSLVPFPNDDGRRDAGPIVILSLLLTYARSPPLEEEEEGAAGSGDNYVCAPDTFFVIIPPIFPVFAHTVLRTQRARDSDKPQGASSGRPTFERAT